MADQPARTDAERDGADENIGTPEGGPTASYPGTPRWVKMTGVIVLALALLVVAVMTVAGGEHGPARHVPSGGAGQAPPTGQVAPKP